jgi:pyruvate,orthophosphate dikinase
MTTHAALVARGWGKCCIVGCASININFDKKEMNIDGELIKEGDWISMNGTIGSIYLGKVSLKSADPESNQSYRELMSWADEVRTLKVRTNAESPADAKQAIAFGAEGIGLCRTEHMFFDPERIIEMRKMILAENESDRRKAVMNLLPFQREDFKGILDAMAGKPVTIRLLDPPLHEFITLNNEQIESLASELDVKPQKRKDRNKTLHELNPMLGHRGCRLGIAYPEITEMQARAIFEATASLVKEGIKAMPEVMIPLVGSHSEYENQEKIVRDAADRVVNETGVDFKYLVGTMIELPRACLTADKIAQKAEFFSFGTNDLTQTTFGISRDDSGKFLNDYIENKIFDIDPFISIDVVVGELMEIAAIKGKKQNKNIKLGICGEHGGDPKSIKFCSTIGLDYVSCSPYRVPVARLAAAQAQLQ